MRAVYETVDVGGSQRSTGEEEKMSLDVEFLHFGWGYLIRCTKRGSLQEQEEKQREEGSRSSLLVSCVRFEKEIENGCWRDDRRGLRGDVAQRGYESKKDVEEMQRYARKGMYVWLKHHLRTFSSRDLT
jgi:hypothetical protein